MIVILGATGHIGRAITERLLERGKIVRVVGRDDGRLAPLVQKGAVPFIGSIDDVAFLSRAFEGSTSAFTLIPPQPKAQDFRAFQRRTGVAIAAAIQSSGLKYVVNLSSQGAHLAQGTGPIVGLHDQEQRLNQLAGVHIVHLRPAFFMENLLMNIDLIRRQGINGTPLKGDLKFPTIATRDIAFTAVEYLSSTHFLENSIHDLLGQRDLTMKEITGILGRAIGKPDLPYVQFPYEDSRRGLCAMGLSEDVARLYIEMYHAFNNGLISSSTVRSAANTTPTRFEDFAQDFARIYAQPSPAT